MGDKNLKGAKKGKIWFLPWRLVLQKKVWIIAIFAAIIQTFYIFYSSLKVIEFSEKQNTKKKQKSEKLTRLKRLNWLFFTYM